MPPAVKADYDKFAQAFSDTRNYPWKEVSDFLEDLPKKSTVLDMGCGNGRHLIEAKKRGLNAVGIDISLNLLKIAKRKIISQGSKLFQTSSEKPKAERKDFETSSKTGVPLILGNALSLPFKENAFDNSICIAVVHHFKAEKERAACLKEIARATEKSILASVWAFEQEKFAKRKSPDIRLGWNKKHPRFYHLFRKSELELLAKTAGLAIYKSWREGNNYWAVFETKARRKTII